MPELLSFSTGAQCDMVDVTSALQACLRNHPDWTDGFLAVTSPHTTCGITINEGYDPDVQADMKAFLSRLIPRDWGFAHVEGNSDAHIKTTLTGTSVLVPVAGGKLDIGRWQAVYLCDYDGPRVRNLRVAFVPAL